MLVYNNLLFNTHGIE